MEGNFFNVKSIHDIKQQPFTDASILMESSKASKYRLNGYDSDVISTNKLAYFEHEKFNIDFKIKEKEDNLTRLTGQIKRAEIYGSASEVLDLKARKKRLEKELYDLRSQKENAESAIKSLKPQTKLGKVFGKMKSFVSKNILAKFSKRVNSAVFLGNYLQNLADINYHVGELISLQTPFGENKDSYEKLTQYLLQANKINANISKTMNRIRH